MRRSAKITGWRRIATALWKEPMDPQIQGILELDARPLLEAMVRGRQAGRHVTPTHVVVRAMAYGLARVPELNVRLVRGRHVQRDSIDLFVITAISSGHDLSGVKVEHADRKSLLEVASEVSDGTRSLRRDDPAFRFGKRMMERVPMPLLKPALKLLGYLSGNLDLRLRPLKVDHTPFGSAMVSSVGMLGLQIGFSPLSRLYRVPILALVGEITPKPVAVDGRVEIVPMLPVSASVDHRFADGYQIAQWVKAVREYLSAPLEHEPFIPGELPAYWEGSDLAPADPGGMGG